jgi:putative ATPase
MRPRSLDEMVGQVAIVGEDGFLRRALAQDRPPSMILWGPPGCGKTTLARLVAQAGSCRYVPFSAVTSGIKEVKEVMADAARFRRADGRRTLLFVDEIHRFNRSQQDAFLPYVERGDIVLVGATTENPSFELNNALLSRCRVVVLEALAPAEQEELLRRALADEERGLGGHSVAVEDDALEAIVQLAQGDARKALNILELAVLDAGPGGRLDAEAVQKVAQRKILLYDKSGEEHFNLISAVHKSLRDSDPDAAIYWVVRMLESGEDGNYLGRRLVRFAVEDIGLAEPTAAARALEGWQIYERLGSPEGDLALAQVALYLALAPKSNATYMALKNVKATLAERPADPVPPVIRNAPTKLMRQLGYGSGYVYAHDTEDAIAGLDCLPEAIQGTRFYQPTDRGFEKRLRERLAELDALRRKARTDRES